MILQISITTILLIVLYILSQKIISYFYLSVFLITKNRTAAISILACVLLPGTIVHELSHFLFALILHVPTGKLSIFPSIETGGEVHAGKLTLGDTDPFRLALIGLAPLVIGIIVLYFLSSFFFLRLPPQRDPASGGATYNPQLYFLLLLGYLLFAVSVTMFSSKKDIQPLKIALPITILAFIGLYYIGIRMLFTANLVAWIDQIVKNLNNSLMLISVLNTIFFICIFLIFAGLQKVLRTRS